MAADAFRKCLDGEALRQALAESEPTLRALIQARLSTRTKSRISPDDVIQDVWIKAHRDLKYFRADGPRSVERWLISLTQNSLLAAIKSEMRLKRGGAEQFANCPERGRSFADFFGKVLFPGRTPSGEAAIVEASNAIRAGLEGLPAARREVLTMRYIDEKTCEEIAMQTGRTLSAVNALIYHGLRQLQGLMGPADRFLSDCPSTDQYSIIGRVSQV